MSTRLTLWRHAPTAENNGEIFMGWQDPPLCEQWWRDNGIALSNEPHPLMTSPLQRATITARRLFPGSTARVDGRLRERCLGAWEGNPKDEVRRRWPAAFINGEGVLDPTFTPPGGETLQQLEDRIASFLEDARSWDSVVAVTHNGWIRTAMWVLGLIDIADIYKGKSGHLEPIDLSI